MMLERVMVTGAAGFIGSHLCDALLGAGHTVVGVDNFCTGDAVNLSHLKSEPRFSLIEQDITQRFDAGKVNFIFNFASPASPVDYMRLGIETLLVGLSRYVEYAGTGPQVWGRLSTCLYLRVLRRPRGSPAGRELLGAM